MQVCPRYTAVEADARVPVTLSNGPSSMEVVTVPKHKKYPPAGKKSQMRTAALWLDQADALEVGVEALEWEKEPDAHGAALWLDQILSTGLT